MTTICSSTTATPFRGEVSLGYWHTLSRMLTKLGLDTSISEGKNSGRKAVKVEQYLDALKTGIANCDDFGMRLGSSVTLKSFPVLGMTLLSCSNLHQVLNQILRYESLNHDLGVSATAIGPIESYFSWTPNPIFISDSESEIGFHLALSVFSGIKSFAPLLIEAELPIKSISFKSKKPSNAEVYKEFFNADISYQQTQNVITFESELLGREVSGGDSTMFRALVTHAENLLFKGETEHSIVWKVQSILPEALRQQSFKIEEIACKLNISTRTLQRRLNLCGCRYQILLDNTRKDLAELYIKENRLSMNEIAFLIGYQEQSSFNHAFKAWTGISPREYREKLINEKAD